MATTVSTFGPLKTLFQALQQSQFLKGVSFIFGDEEINTQRFQIPAIVMAPRGGAYDGGPGYAAGLDPGVEMLWEKQQNVDFWLVNASQNPNSQGAVDHVDAQEGLLVLLLSALQDQRAQFQDTANVAFGLAFTVLSDRWETMANPVSRFGRTLVVTVQIKITIPMATPPVATITTEQLNKTFVDKPS